jgi:hypothetical protein
MDLDEICGSEDGSMILEEEIDPNYVPTKEGIYSESLFKTPL